MCLMSRLLVVALSLLITSTCSADGFSEPVRSGGISFTTYEVDDANIYQQEPIASPDGKYIAFIRIDVKNELRKLWIMDRITGESRPLTGIDPFLDAKEAYPKWSPNGEWISYTSLQEGKTSIRLVDLKSGEIREVTDRHLGRLFGIVSSWSPDSKKIVVNAEVLNGNQLLVFPINGDEPELILEKSRISWPAWSPLEGRIFFAGADHSRGDLWSVDMSSMALEEVDSNGFGVSYVSFSSDGKWLAFQSWEPDGGNDSVGIYVMPSSGGSPQAVTKKENFSFAITVAWDYMPGKILFTGQPQDPETSYAVAVVDTNGSNMRVLKEFTEQNIFTWWRNYPSWSSDEKTIGFSYDKSDTTSVMFISAETGDVLKEFVGHGVDFSPDASEFVTERDDRLWTISVDDGEAYPLTLKPEQGIRALYWSPDGETILYRSESGCNIVSSYGGESEMLMRCKDGGVNLIGWKSDGRNSSEIVFQAIDFIKTKDIYSGGINHLKKLPDSNIWGINISFKEDLLIYRKPNNRSLFLVRNSNIVKEISFPDHPKQEPMHVSLSPSDGKIAIFLVPAFRTVSVLADINSITDASTKLP